ncbi:MAG: hypothetical protein GXY41_10745 [Phycisphaerae bacterium]|nr:hypothetical protein [Phycisphaerae bacterium]
MIEVELLMPLPTISSIKGVGATHQNGDGRIKTKIREHYFKETNYENGKD